MTFLLAGLITLLLLVGIVFACQVFTNAIEWLGKIHNLSEGSVGSILAAVGTAMPETLVPLIAIIASLGASHSVRTGALDIGIGAILGAPFLLSTLAMFLSGAAVFFFAARKKRGTVLLIDPFWFKRDLYYFLPAYGVVFMAGFIHIHWIKTILALGLLAGYGGYVLRTLDIDHHSDEEAELEPLMFSPKAKEPSKLIIWFQALVGIGLIVFMAHLFVNQLVSLSHLLHLAPLLISLLLTPIATELPEKFNSIVWISKRKDNLALGNVTGAMVFQSYILGAIGLGLTPWILDTQGILSVVLCLTSSLVLLGYVLIHKTLTARVLLWGGVFYALFLGYSVWQVISTSFGASSG